LSKDTRVKSSSWDDPLNLKKGGEKEKKSTGFKNVNKKLINIGKNLNKLNSIYDETVEANSQTRRNKRDIEDLKEVIKKPQKPEILDYASYKEYIELKVDSHNANTYEVWRTYPNGYSSEYVTQVKQEDDEPAIVRDADYDYENFENATYMVYSLREGIRSKEAAKQTLRIQKRKDVVDRLAATIDDTVDRKIQEYKLDLIDGGYFK